MPQFAKRFHPLYDQNIIFTLSSPEENDISDKALLTRAKAQRKYQFKEDTLIVPIILYSDNNVALSKDFLQACQLVTKRTRIYIRSHCNAESDELTNDKGTKIKYDYLANLFSMHFSRRSDVFSRSETKLRISLSGCCAGLSGRNPAPIGCANNSFAAKFLWALYQRGINCAISARLGYVTVNYDRGMPSYNVIPPKKIDLYKSIQRERRALIENHFVTEEEVLDPHVKKRDDELKDQMIELYYPKHSPKSKAIYQYNNMTGQQEVLNPYSSKSKKSVSSSFGSEVKTTDEHRYLWREEVIDVINECMISTSSSEKLIGLNQLLAFVINTTCTQLIQEELRKELIAPGSGKYKINTHSGFFSRFSREKTPEHVRLSRLL